MKAWQIIVPIGVAAAGAAAFAALKGKGSEGKAATAKTEKKAAAKKPAMKNPQDGVYTFVSGFQEAVTVDVSFKYDAAVFSCEVRDEGFLAYTSDSHAVVLTGDNDTYDMQIEYAGFYADETFADLEAQLAEKHQAVGKMSYAGGIKYVEGDSAMVCLPIEGDSSSYLLVTIIKGKDNKSTLENLPETDAVKAVLESVSCTRK